MTELIPELDGLSEAEDFFEALHVPYDRRVLSRHRLHLVRVFGLALGSWLRSNPEATPRERRDAAVRALREAHASFSEPTPRERRNPFAPGLVQLGRRR